MVNKCLGCLNEFISDEKESFCSSLCKSETKIRNKPRATEIRNRIKNCLKCNNRIYEKDFKSSYEFENKKYCSHTCVSSNKKIATRKKKEYERKYCLVCGNVLRRLLNEPISRYSVRKYCSYSCSSIGRSSRKVGWYEDKLQIKNQRGC